MSIEKFKNDLASSGFSLLNSNDTFEEYIHDDFYIILNLSSGCYSIFRSLVYDLVNNPSELNLPSVNTHKIDENTEIKSRLYTRPDLYLNFEFDHAAGLKILQNLKYKKIDSSNFIAKPNDSNEELSVTLNSPGAKEDKIVYKGEYSFYPFLQFFAEQGILELGQHIFIIEIGCGEKIMRKVDIAGKFSKKDTLQHILKEGFVYIDQQRIYYHPKAIKRIYL